jgi:hypothetical protein
MPKSNLSHVFFAGLHPALNHITPKGINTSFDQLWLLNYKLLTSNSVFIASEKEIL